MSFSSVIGQERVKKILSTSIKRDRLAHAYLFYGQSGVGSEAMAIAMGKGLNCTEKVLGGCGQCPACQQIQSLDYPGFRLVLPVPSKPKSTKEDKYQNILRSKALEWMENPYQDINYYPEMSTLPVIGINEVRSLKHDVILKMASGTYRIFCIIHADRMTLSAANSLLKLLEEPPENTLLFLTTANVGQLLPTIVSRCQKVRFDPLKDAEIQSALETQLSLSSDKAAFIAKMAGGSLQRAQELVGDEFEQKRDEALTFLGKALDQEPLRRTSGTEELLQDHDKAAVQELLQILLVWFRDAWQLRLNACYHVINVDRIAQIERFLNKWPDFQAEQAIQSTEQAIDYIQKNVYLPLVLHTLSHDLYRCSIG